MVPPSKNITPNHGVPCTAKETNVMIINTIAKANIIFLIIHLLLSHNGLRDTRDLRKNLDFLEGVGCFRLLDRASHGTTMREVHARRPLYWRVCASTTIYCVNILYQIPPKFTNSRTSEMYCYFPNYDNLTYFSSFYCVFSQNSLIHSVVLLALQPLSEHKCLDNGPYFNSMTKCSANGG